MVQLISSLWSLGRRITRTDPTKCCWTVTWCRNDAKPWGFARGLMGPVWDAEKTKVWNVAIGLKEMELEHSRLSWLVFRIVLLFFSSSKWLPSPKFEGTWTCHHLKCSNLWFGRQAHETIIQLRKQLGQAERKKEAARSVVCDPTNHICERNSCGGFETSFFIASYVEIDSCPQKKWMVSRQFRVLGMLTCSLWWNSRPGCRSLVLIRNEMDQLQNEITKRPWRSATDECHKCFINYLESWNKNIGLYDIE